ncbi:MAG: hypothetical protein RMY34_29145 [Aulosira sp. DedQUE10]|nr:hypothetical protein [Aulosira sp. DedQUE10]
MTPEIEQAIAEIKQAFPEHPVDVEAEPIVHHPLKAFTGSLAG